MTNETNPNEGLPSLLVLEEQTPHEVSYDWEWVETL
jgi:hypothetical protein